MRLIRLGSILFLLAASAAEAQEFALYPPCPPFECGDSRLISEATRPSGAVSWEEQSVRIEISAESLLRDSAEHVAIALMAGAEAFAADGSFALPNGPGGGLGVVIGTLSARNHPACPADPDNGSVEFAVERFGWGNPYASTLPVCVSFPRTALDRSPLMELRLSVRCYAGASCSLNATLIDPASDTIIKTLYASGLQLANLGSKRMAWASVTNIMYDDPVRGAHIRVVDHHYHAEP